MSAAQTLFPPSHEHLREEHSRLLMEYLPQVRSIARRIRNRLPQHIDIQDLTSAGVLGLIDACHKYDENKNVKFGTYAQFRIRGPSLTVCASLTGARAN